MSIRPRPQSPGRWSSNSSSSPPLPTIRRALRRHLANAKYNLRRRVRRYLGVENDSCINFLSNNSSFSSLTQAARVEPPDDIPARVKNGKGTAQERVELTAFNIHNQALRTSHILNNRNQPGNHHYDPLFVNRMWSGSRMWLEHITGTPSPTKPTPSGLTPSFTREEVEALVDRLSDLILECLRYQRYQETRMPGDTPGPGEDSTTQRLIQLGYEIYMISLLLHCVGKIQLSRWARRLVQDRFLNRTEIHYACKSLLSSSSPPLP